MMARGPAHRWSQEQPAPHASRRHREPDARQHLHEPVRFLKYWRLTGRGEAFRANVVA